MTDLIRVAYGVIAFSVWFGVMFAVCAVLIAVALVFIVRAIVMGLAMPSRTVGGQLRSLQLNTREAVASVQALR